MLIISIALCTFNGQKYLHRQFDSIFAQTLSVDEIIICDDISTDETLVIVHKFQQLYPGKIKLEVNEATLGPRKNFEKALSLSNGDIIFLCDQDDIWPLDKVAKITAAFEANPNIKGIFTNGILIDERETPIGMDLWGSFLYSPYLQSQLKSDNLFEIILRNGPLVTGATLAVRQIAKPILLPFRHSNLLWHDEWIGYILAAENSLMPYNQNLFSYRVHANQQVGVYLDNLAKRSADNERYFRCQFEPGEERFYIFFMYERLKIAREICSLITTRNDVLIKFETFFKSEKKRALGKLSFFKRKAILLKWVFEKRFETGWSDFF